jgi:hypothetical protein
MEKCDCLFAFVCVPDAAKIYIFCCCIFSEKNVGPVMSFDKLEIGNPAELGFQIASRLFNHTSFTQVCTRYL